MDIFGKKDKNYIAELSDDEMRVSEYALMKYREELYKMPLESNRARGACLDLYAVNRAMDKIQKQRFQKEIKKDDEL